MSFKQHFNSVLNGRLGFIDSLNKVLSKYETDKFGFEIVEQTSYEDVDEESMTPEEFDNFNPTEYPGYMLFLVDKGEPLESAYGGKPQLYKYMMIEAWLPIEKDREFPVSFTLNGKKNYIVASKEQLETDLESIFNSTQFSNLIKKIEDSLSSYRNS